MVRTECAAAEHPRELADLAALDQLARASHVRPKDLAGGSHDAQVALLCKRDQIVGLSYRRRHRLVRMDVLAGIQRRTAMLVVEPDRRRDSDGVDLRLVEHLVDERERTRDAVASGSRLRPLDHRIA